MRKREIELVNLGDKVKVSERIKKFYRDYAYDFNVIGPDRMLEEHAETFLRWKLLGNGYPYKAKVTEYRSNVGDGPGFRVEFTFQCGEKMSTLVCYKDLIRVKK